MALLEPQEDSERPQRSGLDRLAEILFTWATSFLPRARLSDWVVFVLAVLAVVSGLVWLLFKEHPWTLADIADLSKKGSRRYRDYLEPGLWLGALLSVLAVSPLVVFARWWPRGSGARYQVKSPLVSARQPERVERQRFIILLSLILTAAAALRWERLDLSYWGDEGWAVTRYSHGSWRPQDRVDAQGQMRFWESHWAQAFFDDHTGGNHYLFTVAQHFALDVWRGLAGLPREAFSDPVSRLPSFFAGIGSIALLGGLFRWAGLSRTGLWAAFLLALHPMHLRYSSEARGYAMMLFFLIATLWLAALALHSGRWRWWLLFGLCEFLTLYSWKGISYGLACLNLALLAIIIFGPAEKGAPRIPAGARLVTGGRWLAANLLAAGLYLRLVGPCLLQTRLAMEIAGGQPMYLPWLKDTIAQVLTGTPWTLHGSNPGLTALNRLAAAYPLPSSLIAMVFVACFISGIAAIRRRWPRLGLVCLALVVSSILGPLHFKYRLEMEWQTWYSFYLVPTVAILLAFGIVAWQEKVSRFFPRLPGAGPATAYLAGLCLLALQLPQTIYSINHPIEANREAFMATRGRHEPLGHKGPSNVYTVYLWRHIGVYDPRAETKVRTAPDLKKKIEQVLHTNGELYVVMGEPALSRLLSGDMVAMLEDPALFTPTETFWAQNDSLTLRVFHYTGPR